MEFNFSKDEKMLQDSAREYLRDKIMPIAAEEDLRTTAPKRGVETFKLPHPFWIYRPADTHIKGRPRADLCVNRHYFSRTGEGLGFSGRHGNGNCQCTGLPDGGQEM